jgi:hypothetical protein
MFVYHFHEPYPLSYYKNTYGSPLYSNIESIDGNKLGKYCSNIFIYPTNGNNLSIDGLSFDIRGIIGYSFIVLGEQGCINGRFKHLVHDCFLNFTNVCGIFLYLIFHNYKPSNYPNLSMTSISYILFYILSFYPIRD